MNIEGRNVLISGASRGLGRALMLAFAEAGAGEIFAGARRPEDIERLKQEAAASGIRITPIKLEVRSDEDIAATKQLGTIDILVNNAGVAGYGNPLTMSFETALEEMQVNFFGALRLTRALAPTMVGRGEGMIVNIATAFAKINLPLVGTYCASKAALLSLGQALRAYLKDQSVHVMTVMPTTIDTDMAKGADVPKMTTEFVAGEILRHIREESIDPPIGEEAERVLAQLREDPAGLEGFLSTIRA
ncbi:MAG TPA: SDR family NAD(P)-dependent oxidoreductase [Pyrinomonadaceae bacterium]|jgi:short-subunit dehydrogenase|nr:SDR family NAD(P)-dependent oxidoreductase [Pyrinomonadaceae bacterium]